LRRFLIKRGLWLIVVELVIINLAMTFNPLYNAQILQVIWAIGIGLILLGLCTGLPTRAILAIGLVIVAGHNILDRPELAGRWSGHFWPDLIRYAHGSVYKYSGDRGMGIMYAFLPWTGVLFAGYGFGQLYARDVDPGYRRKTLVRLGWALVILFLVFRFFNIYGDPVPWATQTRGSLYTLLSFLNLNKYPPSLLFLCMTLGPGMLALAWLEPVNNRFTSVMNTYGRVPLFYYILHFYLIHFIGVAIFFAQGFPAGKIITPGNSTLFQPPGFGLGLTGIYVVWVLVVVLLYIPCRNYDRYKSTHKKWWLGYL